MPEGFDYSLRHAKNIERKLICDSIARLARFGALEEYQYIGFGSIWFVDFRLFHKRFGISTMTSIENEIPIDRCRWNAPFDCIEVLEGSSADVLPTLSYERRAIAWLDYICGIEQSVLDDIATVVEKARSGSCLIVTVNCGVGKLGEPMQRVDALRRMVEKDFVPAGLTNGQLSKNTSAAGVYGSVMQEAAKAAAKRRTLTTGVERHVEQVMLFYYRDGAPMATWGAVVVDEDEMGLLRSCGFDQSEFFRADALAYSITPPLLTFKEMGALDQALPSANQEKLDIIPVSAEEAGQYRALYRHFPRFAEAQGI